MNITDRQREEATKWVGSRILGAEFRGDKWLLAILQTLRAALKPQTVTRGWINAIADSAFECRERFHRGLFVEDLTAALSEQGITVTEGK